MGMMRYSIITLLLFSLVENFEFHGAHNYTHVFSILFSLYVYSHT